jgi:uncharacterized paraquat-inducible protein A
MGTGVMTSFSVSASGKAVVCCVHDRVKREVITEAQVMAIGLEIGIRYNPIQHKLWVCSCCENLFVDPSDEPQYCKVCQVPPVHNHTSPLPKPNGRPI